jgi:hypothetical protein
VVARLCRRADVLLRLGEHVEGAHQILARKALRQHAEPLALGLDDVSVVEP